MAVVGSCDDWGAWLAASGDRERSKYSLVPSSYYLAWTDLPNRFLEREDGKGQPDKDGAASAASTARATQEQGGRVEVARGGGG